MPTVVKLLEPEICLKCRFFRKALVEINGDRRTMIRCTRGDCDNWDHLSIEDISDEKLKRIP